MSESTNRPGTPNKTPARPDAGFATYLAGFLNERDLATVVQHADKHALTLVDAVVALGFMNESKAYASFAEWMDRPFVDLRVTPPQPTAARLLPERVSKKHHVIAIAQDNRTMTYATPNLFDAEVDRDVSFASGRRAQMVVVMRSQLMGALGQAYKMGHEIDRLIDRIKMAEVQADLSESKSITEANDSPIIEVCNRIVATAIAAGASDIHIEPGTNGAPVRHRISGILEPMLTLPQAAVRGVTNRFKLMAKTDIALKQRPQDGAFRVMVDDENVDVRLSTVPTIHGEKIVMRVIQGGAGLMTIDSLGYQEATAKALISALSKPDGLVLVTGPTGSGKTTVLYAALHFLKTGRVNIVTVEDPVERQIDGVTQIPVNTKQGTTFATVLRSVMRQDPNIIMVGEVRDAEVAEIVGQAAFTGHLVLSSLHTTDAASAITRLLNLGLQPFKVAESLNAVVAQRLVRKLCKHCAVVNDAETAARLGEQHGISKVHSSVGRGCDQCKQSGYIGRIAVPEILLPDDAIRQAIRNGAALQDVRAAMFAAGSISMRQRALQLVTEGVTSIEEVNRVFTDHQEDTQIARPAAPTESVPQGAPAPATAAPVNKRKVLIADDDRMTRLILRMMLEKEGLAVFEADNGATGMETARRERPDLMMVDLQMPDMDGFQFLEITRGDEKLMSVPVIVLTSDTSSEVEAKVLEMGADDYVS
ncbi:MAG TPA: type II/IV secretion system protein, partial [Vicinamibacterales bacterium]|nr:type II/IV secretion system protein [Vicinamibacterales bacterium]